MAVVAGSVFAVVPVSVTVAVPVPVCGPVPVAVCGPVAVMLLVAGMKRRATRNSGRFCCLWAVHTKN